VVCILLLHVLVWIADEVRPAGCVLEVDRSTALM